MEKIKQKIMPNFLNRTDFENAQLELVQYKTFNILIHVKLSVCT